MFGGGGRITDAIWLTVSGWIFSLRARRRLKKSLGRKATDLECVAHYVDEGGGNGAAGRREQADPSSLIVITGPDLGI